MVFDRLASSISLDERHELLDKLKNQSSISNVTLYFDDRETLPQGNLETEFAALPWLSRFLYAFLSFFRGKSAAVIFGDSRVAALSRKIDERSPGLYNHEQRMLLPEFYRQMDKLKAAARFFYSSLDSSVNRDKGSFFAFLASLEMAEVHKELEVETEPLVIAEKYPDLPDMEQRQMAFGAMDSALSLITEKQRETMYSAARSLNCLKGLSSFLFDRLLMAFNTKNAKEGPMCSVNVVRELLFSLNDILFSLKVVPPMTLLESLFIFTLQERSGEAGFNINKEIQALLAKAEASLTVIRDFNRKVPLSWILRCADRNMSLQPKEMIGGEDWFLVYREHWRKKIDANFAVYFRTRRRTTLLNAFSQFFKGAILRSLAYAYTENSPDGLNFRGAFALSFLMTYHSAVFIPETNKILSPILIDGNFYRKENRTEFTEAYNNFLKLEDNIKKLENDISPAGDYGKRYAQAQQEMTSLPVKRRKIQIVLEDVQDDAEIIRGQIRRAVSSMINLIGGFLGRDTKGKYDILTNLSALGAKTSDYQNALNETLLQFQKMGSLLDEIEAMEDGR